MKSELCKVQKVQFKLSSQHWTKWSIQVFNQLDKNWTFSAARFAIELLWTEFKVNPEKEREEWHQKGKELQNLVFIDKQEVYFLLFLPAACGMVIRWVTKFLFLVVFLGPLAFLIPQPPQPPKQPQPPQPP